MSDELRERIARALEDWIGSYSVDFWPDCERGADAVLAALSDAPTVEDRILQVLDRLSPACRAEFLRLWRDPAPTEPCECGWPHRDDVPTPQADRCPTCHSTNKAVRGYRCSANTQLGMPLADPWHTKEQD